jgi:hypothetical protein
MEAIMEKLEKKENDSNIVILSGDSLLKQYNHYRDMGWKTEWTGEGKICMRKNPE